MDILFFISIELLLVIIDIMDNSNIWIEYVTMHVCICIYIRFQISANFFLFSFAVKYSFHDYRFYRELSTIQYNTNIAILRKQVEPCFLFLRECITNWKFAWKTTLTTLKLKNSSAES